MLQVYFDNHNKLGKGKGKLGKGRLSDRLVTDDAIDLRQVYGSTERLILVFLLVIVFSFSVKSEPDVDFDMTDFGAKIKPTQTRSIKLQLTCSQLFSSNFVVSSCLIP